MGSKKTKEQIAITNQSIINQAKALNICGKHAGSKPIKRLKKGIQRANEAFAIYLKNKNKIKV